MTKNKDINPGEIDFDELEDFIILIRDLVKTVEEVAVSLQKKEMYKESAELFKPIFKIQEYINSDGHKKSTTD